MWLWRISFKSTEGAKRGHPRRISQVKGQSKANRHFFRLPFCAFPGAAFVCCSVFAFRSLLNEQRNYPQEEKTHDGIY
jgi:hypothetical protein